MALRIILRSKALTDAAEFGEYLARNSAEVAARFLDAVDETIAQLAVSPDLGNDCGFEDEQAAGLRYWRVNGFPHHLILYRADADELDVLSIQHASRDWRATYGE